jgi:hypothetical protein
MVLVGCLLTWLRTGIDTEFAVQRLMSRCEGQEGE